MSGNKAINIAELARWIWLKLEMMFNIS